MTIERLLADAKNLPDWFDKLEVSTGFLSVGSKVKSPLVPGVAKHDVESVANAMNLLLRHLSIDTKRIRPSFGEHCEVQHKVLTKVREAAEEALAESGKAEHDRKDATTTSPPYSDVTLFVTGSLAKLEYIADVSDIDMVGMTTVAERPLDDCVRDTICKVEHASKLKERLTTLEERLKAKLKIKLDISGKPFHDGKYFFSQKDLFERLGDFDEPSWAVSHRHSLLFESASCPGTRQIRKSNGAPLWSEAEFAAQTRSKINERYSITADLMRMRQFPAVAALLISALEKNAILATISMLTKPPEDPRESRPEDKLMSKALISRIWSAAAHLITLHLLFWTE